MKKIGLFYGTGTNKTAAVAKKIKETFDNKIEVIPVADARKEDFESYDNIIAGAATWFDGELPTLWDEALPELESLDLTGKKVAIFGLGDQAGYPDNFVDGIGILADLFTSRGATLVGQTSPDGYTFTQSRALRNGKFQGLAIDIENQPDLTDERIQRWVKQIQTEFESTNRDSAEDSFVC